MSRQVASIEIFPEKYNSSQEYSYTGFTCPCCRGEGGFKNQTGKETFKREVCKRCDGTGKLKAKVLVAWTPDCD